MNEIALRIAIAQEVNGETGYYKSRELQDGSRLGLVVQLFNVALHLYPPGSPLAWSDSW